MQIMIPPYASCQISTGDELPGMRLLAQMKYTVEKGPMAFATSLEPAEGGRTGRAWPKG